MKCIEKTKFLTRNMAKKRRKIAENLAGKKLYIYKCGECGYFHYSSLGIKEKIVYRLKKVEGIKNVENVEK